MFRFFRLFRSDSRCKPSFRRPAFGQVRFRFGHGIFKEQLQSTVYIGAGFVALENPVVDFRASQASGPLGAEGRHNGIGIGVAEGGDENVSGGVRAIAPCRQSGFEMLAPDAIGAIQYGINKRKADDVGFRPRGDSAEQARLRRAQVMVSIEPELAGGFVSLQFSTGESMGNGLF